MWTDFSKRSQRTLTEIVNKSAAEGRLHITMPRIESMVQRLQEDDTPGELRLKALFGLKADIRSKRPKSNYSPLSFLYEGALASYTPMGFH